MGVVIYSFNLSVSPKMSYGVLECDTCHVTELYAYDFVVKDFVMKRALFMPGPVFLGGHRNAYYQMTVP